jgi:hypothetical protein
LPLLQSKGLIRIKPFFACSLHLCAVSYRVRQGIFFFHNRVLQVFKETVVTNTLAYFVRDIIRNKKVL